VSIIVFLFFIRTSREVVDSYINAYGLFHDIWAPAVEAVLNISCSILFGWLWGLPGILSGVLLSQIVIILVWKPILLFSRGLKRPLVSYIGLYFKHLAILAVSGFLTWFLTSHIPLDPAKNYLAFFICGLIMAVISMSLLGGGLYITEQGMRDFSRRIFSYLKK
jgi:hypothetical protein